MTTSKKQVKIKKSTTSTYKYTLQTCSRKLCKFLEQTRILPIFFPNKVLQRGFRIDIKWIGYVNVSIYMRTHVLALVRVYVNVFCKYYTNKWYTS